MSIQSSILEAESLFNASNPLRLNLPQFTSNYIAYNLIDSKVETRKIKWPQSALRTWSPAISMPAIMLLGAAAVTSVQVREGQPRVEICITIVKKWVSLRRWCRVRVVVERAWRWTIVMVADGRSMYRLLLRRQGVRAWHHTSRAHWWVRLVTADEVENTTESVWRRLLLR